LLRANMERLPRTGRFMKAEALAHLSQMESPPDSDQPLQ
jgi:hypothetical protein